MSSQISQYKNVFNEPATPQNLSHIFDILNDKNDDRIVLRDFTMHMEHVGLKLDKKATKQVYNHISSSVKRNRNITKEAWTKGIKTAHKEANTKKLYSYILSGRQYDPQPGREEIDMEEIRIKLKDTKAPWMYRIECMESLCRQITNKSLSKDKFHEKFRNYHISLTVQAKDRRSNVSRVACECIAKVILCWKNEYLKYAYTTIEYIYELVRQKIQVVHESGYSVLKVLLKNCGDHKAFKMMDILGREGTTSKFVNLKVDCFDLLVLYLTQQNQQLKSNKEFWNRLLEYTEKGINDTADVRNSALKLLAQIQVERPQLVGDIIHKMSVHLKKRWESEYMISNGVANGHNGDEKWDMSLDPIKTKKNKKDKSSKTPKTPKSPNAPKTPKSPRGGGKSSASYPKAPKGEFLNGFGEKLNENDMAFAFDFIDYKKDRKITLDEFQTCCKRLNVNGNPDNLFSTLDDQKSQYVTLNSFKSAISKRNSSLMDFWNKLLSGKHLEQTPFSSDTDFESANKCLLNNKNSEDDRLNAMYSTTRKICNQKKWDNPEKFEKQFKKSLGPLLNQLKDRNNSMVREACVCLSKIFIAKKGMFRNFTNRTLDNLSEAIKLQDHKIHISAKQSVATMIKYIPDRSACPMMKIICNNCCDKNFAKLRTANFEYVNYYLFVMIKEFEEKKKLFWDFLEKAVKSGIADSDPVVRDLAYIALVKVEMLQKDLAEKYVSTLKKARKEKFDSLKKDELRRIQKGEMYQVDGGTTSIDSNESIKAPKTRKQSKATRKESKANNKSYKIHKRPRDDVSDDEKKDEARLKREKQRQEKEKRLAKEKAQRLEKLRREKADKERAEKQRLLKEKQRKEKADKERLTKQKSDKERLERENLAKAKADKERLAGERAEKERLEKQKLLKEKEKREKLERAKKAEKQRLEKDKLAEEKAERERLKKERLAKQKKERLEKLETNFRENAEKERLQKEKNDEINYSKAEEERREKIRKMKEEERRERLERQRQEKEKVEQEEKEENEVAEKHKSAKEQLEKQKAERERKRQEKLEKQQKETREKVQKLKEQQRLEKKQQKKEMSEGSDYGYPTVHACARRYFEEKGVKCHNPTHLVLYAKRNGLNGVGFAKVNKYYKAQK